MKLILSALVALTCQTAFSQTQKELKQQKEIKKLKKEIKKRDQKIQILTKEYEEVKSRPMPIVIGSKFASVPDLIIFDGMYIDRADIDPNKSYYKQEFLKKFEKDAEYRKNVLRTFDLHEDVRVLGFGFQDCDGKAMKYSASDAVRYIACSATIITGE